jgi:hypothetical protein
MPCSNGCEIGLDLIEEVNLRGASGMEDKRQLVAKEAAIDGGPGPAIGAGVITAED